MAKNKVYVAPESYLDVTPSKSPVEGLSREEFFMVFSAFIARGNTPDAAFKLTRQYMPKVIKALDNGG